MKRLISANTSEMLAMNAEELKQSIKASEGRVILSENVATRETYIKWQESSSRRHECCKSDRSDGRFCNTSK